MYLLQKLEICPSVGRELQIGEFPMLGLNSRKLFLLSI
ncbi:hypothetical protein T03_12721 [Trichinella britovi]|uniref:Uncharacterized protein n=1 Tax=Trichinella britovi TaxID=45882 RepID=A0A0V0YT60_TRIBR|nr:hypothetical protein T03_12721 [Trichinella britovi]